MIRATMKLSAEIVMGGVENGSHAVCAMDEAKIPAEIGAGGVMALGKRKIRVGVVGVPVPKMSVVIIVKCG